ncbi:MAG TPA: glycosyltransferase, partial [Flavisolibacter sp.]|nr:glycosyltransferase [Flavisolibacter sp.]
MSELISIVLCTYNGERFLTEQMDSLLNQTWPDLEIIVSDDCSADRTRQILSSYGHHPHISIYYQDINLGPIKNFEFVLSKAKGEYIAFCVVDDIWKPDKIKILHKSIGNALLTYSDSELIDETGKSLGKCLSDLRNMYSGTETKGFVFDNVVWGHTALLSKKLLSIALPFPETVPHDIWFAYLAAANGGIKYINNILSFYRQHQGA